MSTFKVGDRVRITGDGGIGSGIRKSFIGLTAQVVEVDADFDTYLLPEQDRPDRGPSIGRRANFYWPTSALEKVGCEKPQVGDKVRVTYEGTVDTYFHGSGSYALDLGDGSSITVDRNTQHEVLERAQRMPSWWPPQKGDVIRYDDHRGGAGTILFRRHTGWTGTYASHPDEQVERGVRKNGADLIVRDGQRVA